MVDTARLSAMLEAAATIFGRAVTPQLVLLYQSVLRDYTDEEAAEAFRAHLVGPQGKFWPTPAHLLEALRGDSEAAAALALSRSGRCYGDDPIANRVILAMGGEFACRYMEAGVFTGQFRRFYEALHKAGVGEKLAETRGFLAPGETLSMPELMAAIRDEPELLAGSAA